MLVLPCACCGTVPPLACCPCDIPKSTITVNYLSTGTAGNGSTTLTYTPADHVTFFVDHWEGAGCIDLGILNPTGSDPRRWSMNFHGFCADGIMSFLARFYIDSGACGGSVISDHGLVITSYTCSPFHIHHAVGGSDIYPSSVLNQAGFSSIDFDSPDSTTGSCIYNFRVLEDCNFSTVAGVVVTLWTNSGKSVLLGSATTDSIGECTIVLPAWTSGPYYEVSGSRFDLFSSTFTPGIPRTTDVEQPIITASATYKCSGYCAWPELQTLHATHPVFGAITYTWSSFHWRSTVSYSYPGNVAGGGTCTAKTVTVTCDWDGAGGYQESWKTDGTDCPDNSGGTTTFAFWTDDSVTCYVPSVSAFSKVFTYTPGSGSAQENLYGVGPLTIAITE